MLTVDGEELSIKDWQHRLRNGIDAKILLRRFLVFGWSAQDTVRRPLKVKQQKDITEDLNEVLEAWNARQRSGSR